MSCIKPRFVPQPFIGNLGVIVPFTRNSRLDRAISGMELWLVEGGEEEGAGRGGGTWRGDYWGVGAGGWGGEGACM